MLQAKAAENWTAWRSEGYKTGLDKLKEKFTKTDSRILEVSDDDNSRLEESSQIVQTPSLECKLVDRLRDSFQEVREKFGNLSGSRIEDLSASELEELLGEISKVEEESLENAKKDLLVRKLPSENCITEEAMEATTILDKSKSKEEGEKGPENSELGLTLGSPRYEDALESLGLKFKDLSGRKVDELDRDQAEELISGLRLLHVKMLKEKKDQYILNKKRESGKQEKGVEEKKLATKEKVEAIKVKVEPHEAVNSTLVTQSMPPPPAPPELSPIKPNKDSSRDDLHSCLKGSRGFPLDELSVSWKEEASIHYFGRVQVGTQEMISVLTCFKSLPKLTSC